MKTLTPDVHLLPEFIAENQAEAADDVLVGTKSELVAKVNVQSTISTTCMCGFSRRFFPDGFERGGTSALV